MKVSKSSLVLGLLAAGTAHAADLVPTQFKAIETDLARSELQLEAPYSFRLGLNFVEGHRYLMHPSSRETEESSAIRRELNFSLMLPHRLEAGVSLYDNQQATASESLDHKSQKLSGAIYARYHIVQSEGLRSSILVQYEPGTGDRRSFHQPSQDKTGIALAVDGTPLDYLQLGGYLGMTKRNDEKFRVSRINDEVLYGMRISAGPEMLKLFGDLGIRSLPWRTTARGDTMHTGRHYEIGLQGSYRDLHIQASKFVPSSERFVGEPERGFKISVSYVFGKARSEAKESEQASPEALEKEDAVKAKDKPEGEAKAQPTPSIDSFDAMPSDVKDEALGAIPVVGDELPRGKAEEKTPEALMAPGSDEFEKWETTQASDAKRAETPQEKAEREYRDQVAKEKQSAATVEAQAKSAEELEKERLLKEIEAEEKRSTESAADIEKELNQYTLPGADELNWNGLGNK